jgi:RNA polymerase sigma factor (sigma-70 family)
MPHRLTDVVRRAAGVAGRVSNAPDRELLAAYVADRDADAFAELVRRHGAMVRGVCRRTLGNSADVDDACQAAFLVLARKAAAVRRADAVGSWLYGVARRVAWKARQKRAASRERVRPVVLEKGPVADASGSADLSDLLAVLDEELARLPDAYRAPLVLCYLEGRTQDEAARQLGWSLGAFRGRLERGRARLRARLDRRGVGLAVLAAVAASDATAGAVPAGIVGNIVTAATAVAAGDAVAVPAGVAALAAEVLRTMTMTKLQWAAGVVAVCGLLTAGGMWATGQGIEPSGQPPLGGGTAPPAMGRSGQPPAERQAGPGQRQKSMNNLKQIMLAIHNYHDAYGHLPTDIRDKDGKRLLSWRVAILPFIERDNLYKQFKLDESWDSEHNLKLLAQLPPVYRVGIEPKDSTHTFYQAFNGPNTPLQPPAGWAVGRGLGGRGDAAGGPSAGPGEPRGFGRAAPPAAADPALGPPGNPPAAAGRPGVRFADITDGTSNTLAVIEAGPPVPWTKPADIAFDPAKPTRLAAPFARVLHAAMMDGSAHALKRDLDPDLLRRLIVMNDGEVVSFKDLHAPRTAETPEEQADLRKKVQENRHVIDQVHRLMTELADLLAEGNNLAAVEEMADRLQGLEKELKAEIRRLRQEQRAKP